MTGVWFSSVQKPATNGGYDMLWFGVTPYPAPITNPQSWSSSGLFFVNLTLAQLVEIWSPVYHLHLVIIAMDIHLFLERGTPAGPPNCVVSSMFLSTLCVIYCYFIFHLTYRIHLCYIYIYLYMVTFTINIPPMLAYIPAPWIRHG